MTKLKNLFAIFAIFAFVLLNGAGVLAQEQEAVVSEMIAPRMPGEAFGQGQYYSVVFDGEGEAAVAAKLEIHNDNEETLESTTVEIPGNNIRLIRAVQEVYEKERQCINWNRTCEAEDEYDCIKYSRECDQWRWITQRRDPVYYSVETESEQLSNSTKYVINLEKALENQGESALLLYYKVPKIAEEKWGVFNFSFETLKVPYDVKNARVAVNVQDDFILKGGESETQYKTSYNSAMESASPLEAGAQSKLLQNFSRDIRYQRGYVKETSGLDPWESFMVKGEYAKSRFALYRKAILGWTVSILAFLAVVIIGIWRLVRRIKRKKAIESSLEKKDEKTLPLKIIGIGIGTAVGIIVFIVLTSLLHNFITDYVHYQYRSLIGLLMVLLDGILILGAIFGPSLYFGMKHGTSSGVWMLATIIVSLLILGIITVIVAAVIESGSYRTTPYIY